VKVKSVSRRLPFRGLDSFFAPYAIDSSYLLSAQVGEVSVYNESLSEFHKDVHRVFDQFSDEEIFLFGSLSPHLKAVITGEWQKRQVIS